MSEIFEKFVIDHGIATRARRSTLRKRSFLVQNRSLLARSQPFLIVASLSKRDWIQAYARCLGLRGMGGQEPACALYWRAGPQRFLGVAAVIGDRWGWIGGDCFIVRGGHCWTGGELGGVHFCSFCRFGIPACPSGGRERRRAESRGHIVSSFVYCRAVCNSGRRTTVSARSCGSFQCLGRPPQASKRRQFGLRNAVAARRA